MVRIVIGGRKDLQQLLVTAFLERRIAGAIIHSSQRTQQDRHGDRALAVEFECEVIALAGFELHPRSTIGNEFGRSQLSPCGAILWSFEINTGRTDELRDDHALSAVDDEGALLGHDREIAEEDVLLDGFRYFRTGQQDGDIERCCVGQITLHALFDIVLRILEPIPELEFLAFRAVAGKVQLHSTVV